MQWSWEGVGVDPVAPPRSGHSLRQRAVVEARSYATRGHLLGREGACELQEKTRAPSGSREGGKAAVVVAQRFNPRRREAMRG